MREERRRSRDEVCGRRGEGAEGEGVRRKEERLGRRGEG